MKIPLQIIFGLTLFSPSTLIAEGFLDWATSEETPGILETNDDRDGIPTIIEYVAGASPSVLENKSPVCWRQKGITKRVNPSEFELQNREGFRQGIYVQIGTVC